MRHSKKLKQINNGGNEGTVTALINVMDSFLVYQSYSIYVDV